MLNSHQFFSAKPITKIGIIDSGIGGLTVMQPLLNYFPANYYYFADTKNLPYGLKSKEELLNISFDNIEMLLSFDVEIIIIACHTISATILDDLKKHYSHILFIDVIQPVIKKALEISKNKKIGVIGTTATIESHIYKKTIATINPEIEIFEQECPRLASLIEELPETLLPIRYELKKNLLPLKKLSIDTLILGCTHYKWVQELINDYLPVKIISVETEIISYLVQKKFITSRHTSSIVCILSKANLSIKNRFNHLLNNFNVPFSMKVLNQLDFSSNV